MLLCESQTQKYNKKTGVNKNDPSDPFYVYQSPCFTLGLLKGQIIWGHKLESRPPLFGLHGWTMGKDKLLKKPSWRGKRQDYQGTDFLSALFTLCVCMWLQWERRGQKTWASVMKRPQERWDHFKWDLTYTHTHTHTFIVLGPTQPTQCRAGYCCTMQSFLKPAELTKPRAQGFRGCARTKSSGCSTLMPIMYTYILLAWWTIVSIMNQKKT